MGDVALAFITGMRVCMKQVVDAFDDCQPRGQYERFDDHLMSRRLHQIRDDIDRLVRAEEKR